MPLSNSGFNFASLSNSETNDKTNKLILDKALELFIDFGVRRTTMEDIAKSARIGRATLYRRFSDKDQLLNAVIFQESVKNLSRLEKKIADIESPLEGLIEAFVQAALMTYKNKLIKRLMKTEPDYILPFLTSDLGPILQFATQYLSAQISKAQAEGYITDKPADKTAELLLRIIQSLVLSPQGGITPKNEESLRFFANEYLRPLLEPR